MARDRPVALHRACPRRDVLRTPHSLCPWASDRGTGSAAHETPTGEVGPRQPCPCGSGRRYKACHGSAAGRAVGVRRASVRRPGRRVRPGGAARVRALRHRTGHRSGSRGPRRACSARCCPGPPRRWSAQDGTVWLGMQVQHGFGDASRDLAAALLTALEGEPGQVVDVVDDPGDRAAAAGPAGRRTARGHRARGFRVLARRRRGPRRLARRGARERQRRGQPHPPAGLGRRAPTGPTSPPRSTCAGRCRTTRTRCSTRWPGCTPPATTGWSATRGWSACSGPTACWSRSGTWCPAPEPRRWRSPPPRSRPLSTPPWPHREALTGDERAARAGLANRQLTLR